MEEYTENFGFAFNDTDFSDRVLHIQITPELCSTPNLKKLKYSLINSPPPTQTDISDSCTEIQLKSLHLSSPILAAKSPFFYKKEATLRIHSSEETCLMDLLKFMYTNTLSATTCSDLVDVLMAADKFEVKSCIKHCLRLLSEMPMSVEIALLYLEIPSTVLVIQQLKDASKQYLVGQFKDFEDSKEKAVDTKKKKAMELPLDALKIILGSEGCEGLRVNSEHSVYEFILKWARAHYPKLKERKEILNKQFAGLLCFPYMSCAGLRDVLVNSDFSGAKVSRLVMEAFSHKAEDPSKYFATTKTQRLYNYRPVKVVPVEFSLPRCIIYFNLKKQECRDMFPSSQITSEGFLKGGEWFYIGVERSDEQLVSDQRFSVFVSPYAGSKTCRLDVAWAVMKKTSNEYEIQVNDKNCIVEHGWEYLFPISWDTFVSGESEYFIDDVLHLRLSTMGAGMKLGVTLPRRECHNGKKMPRRGSGQALPRHGMPAA